MGGRWSLEFEFVVPAGDMIPRAMKEGTTNFGLSWAFKTKCQTCLCSESPLKTSP